MGFAKFNICSPCCNYEFTCHPYVVVNITDPRDNLSATPTQSDLFSELVLAGGSFPCQVTISMYPSGGNYEMPVLLPSSIAPCNIPIESFFGTNHTTGKFIELYSNGSIIDLNTILKKVTSNSRQRFDIVRDTGANAIQCGSTFGNGPIVTGCQCYEVADNNSSAWGMITYQVYPNEFFNGCSSGQYLGDNIYTDCSQIFNFCSSDICNGSGVEKHQSVKLPYCLTKITAEFPYNIDGANTFFGEGTPDFVAFYDNSYGICNTGTTLINQKTAIISSCFSATGNIYTWYFKPNIYRSGCGNLYINAPYNTSAVFDWGGITTYTSPPVGLCNNQTRLVLFDCVDSAINICGETNFSAIVLDEKEGYVVPGYQCSVVNNCPECESAGLGSFGKTTFAKKPLSSQVTYTLPHAAGYEYNGDLYLDNVPWEGYAGIAAGCGIWVPTPFTQTCLTTYDLSFAAFVAATVTSISYIGYQPSTYCFRGVGCGNLPTCYENEWNYALVYAYSVDMGFGCSPQSHPVVIINSPTRYYPTDSQNSQYECCDKITGSPNGTIVATNGDCDPLPSPDFAYRNASPSNLWNTQTCCEAYIGWFAYPAGLTWAQFCNTYGIPECIYDEMPQIKNPQSYSLTNDICNDVIDCSVYDADGNLVYTVTI